MSVEVEDKNKFANLADKRICKKCCLVVKVYHEQKFVKEMVLYLTWVRTTLFSYASYYMASCTS